MMKKHKVWWLVLALALALVLCAACGETPPVEGENVSEGSTTSDTDSSKIIRVSVSGTPVLDPAVGIDYGSCITMVNLYESLVRPGSDGEIEPCLAESWDISEDGLTYTFHLKEGVKFHDGSEMKASDVVFSVNRLLTIGEGFAYIYASAIDSVEAIDDYTVKFSLTQPFGPFLASLPRLAILSEGMVTAHIDTSSSAYGEMGDYGKNWLLTNDAGTGPYTVKELVQQSHVYAEKFADWHGDWDPNAPDSFRLIDNTESTTVRTMMASKELEITDQWQTVENLNAMAKLDGVSIASYSTGLVQYLHMNNKLAPTDDVNFRRALGCLLDYQMFLDNIFIDSTLASGPVSSYVPGYVETENMTYNIEKAKEYLAQSKYADNYQDYPVELLVNSDVADMEKMALAVQSAASQIGIKVEITKAPWVTIQERISNPDTTPNLVSINSAPSYNEAGSVLEASTHSKTCGTYENIEWVQSEELDGLIEDALATLDDTERFAKYDALQHKIVDEYYPCAYLCNLAERVAYQSSYIEWPDVVTSDGTLSNNIMGYQYYFANMRIYPDRK